MGETLEYALVNPDTVGFMFVKQYYSVLDSDPQKLHRFYAPENSVLSHGVEGHSEDEPAKGQEAINQLIMDKFGSLSWAVPPKITQADCQYGPDRETILIQVIGYLVADNAPIRKFCQTFCLQKEGGQGSKIRYSIHNDIFRWLDEKGMSLDVDAQSAAAAGDDAKATPNGAVAKHDAPPPEAAAEVEEGTELLKEVEASSVLFSGMMNNLENAAAAPPVAQVAEQPPAAGVDTEVAAPAAAPEVADAAPVEVTPVDEVKPKGPVSYASAIAKTAPTRPASVPAKAVGTRTQATRPSKSVSPAGAAAGVQGAAAADGDQTRGSRSADKGQQHVSLYVRGLPQECTEEHLEKLFSEYGAIRKPRGVTIHANKNPPKNPNQPHGRYAFVDFEERDACAACLADSKAGKPFTVCGRKIFVVERQNDAAAVGVAGVAAATDEADGAADGAAAVDAPRRRLRAR
eukprot:CAMPEP_0206309138 /NCGR_PEP_ID=MMETSP0106_2-20121207/12228_1 /ASSEMBLY_ACC=CAM_ASM_000206 /TAXON_ID=81532 /ORGANISM="Acanthoeca-like sp., Strain 10tr" /LENGTH=458 /DNA_ID=CAMNT_0053740215 /DNA_START=115 /DNA_END=1488 /DNA_ORIENTATION=+